MGGSQREREGRRMSEHTHVAAKGIRRAVGHRQREHHILVATWVNRGRVEVVREAVAIEALLARARPLKGSLARLAKRHADGHVLRLAHWGAPAALAATAALALALAAALAGILIEAGRVMMKGLPVGHVAVVVVPLRHARVGSTPSHLWVSKDLRGAGRA